MDLSYESESNSVFKHIVEWQAIMLVLKHMAHPVEGCSLHLYVSFGNFCAQIVQLLVAQ